MGPKVIHRVMAAGPVVMMIKGGKEAAGYCEGVVGAPTGLRVTLCVNTTS